MKKFSETQPEPQARETDRLPLKAGSLFILAGFVVGPSKKCPEGVAKINGYDLITKAPVKYWYCGKAVLHQLQNMQKSVGMDSGRFNEEIRVRVVEIKGDKGIYLSLADPE
jgi:hypothetical protein